MIEIFLGVIAAALLLIGWALYKIWQVLEWGPAEIALSVENHARVTSSY